jgi:hypothetical protein
MLPAKKLHPAKKLKLLPANKIQPNNAFLGRNSMLPSNNFDLLDYYSEVGFQPQPAIPDLKFPRFQAILSGLVEVEGGFFVHE